MKPEIICLMAAGIAVAGVISSLLFGNWPAAVWAGCACYWIIQVYILEKRLDRLYKLSRSRLGGW